MGETESEPGTPEPDRCGFCGGTPVVERYHGAAVIRLYPAGGPELVYDEFLLCSTCAALFDAGDVETWTELVLTVNREGLALAPPGLHRRLMAELFQAYTGVRQQRRQSAEQENQRTILDP